jgi:D-glycero-D-manno-heptose 1,7-bisphosphate phosphatase
VIVHSVRSRRAPDVVLFDRDGTLVVDVPYNGDPERVRPVAGARAALDLLRAAGIATGVVTNQSGIARGLITAAETAAVNRRIERLLGPFAVWEVCPHGPDGNGRPTCVCRKPRPGMVLAAAGRLGVPPDRVAVIGDIGADVEAARAAGAAAVLVPTPATRPEEVTAAPVVQPDLMSAVRHLVGARR